MKTIVCPKCNKHNPSDAWICVRCGKWLLSKPDFSIKDLMTKRRLRGLLFVVFLFALIFGALLRLPAWFTVSVIIGILITGALYSNTLFVKETVSQTHAKTQMCPSYNKRNCAHVKRCIYCTEVLLAKTVTDTDNVTANKMSQEKTPKNHNDQTIWTSDPIASYGYVLLFGLLLLGLIAIIQIVINAVFGLSFDLVSFLMDHGNWLIPIFFIIFILIWEFFKK